MGDGRDDGNELTFEIELELELELGPSWCAVLRFRFGPSSAVPGRAARWVTISSFPLGVTTVTPLRSCLCSCLWGTGVCESEQASVDGLERAATSAASVFATNDTSSPHPELHTVGTPFSSGSLPHLSMRRREATSFRWRRRLYKLCSLADAGSKVEHTSSFLANTLVGASSWDLSSARLLVFTRGRWACRTRARAGKSAEENPSLCKETSPDDTESFAICSSLLRAPASSTSPPSSRVGLCMCRRVLRRRSARPRRFESAPEDRSSSLNMGITSTAAAASCMNISTCSASARSRAGSSSEYSSIYLKEKKVRVVRVLGLHLKNMFPV